MSVQTDAERARKREYMRRLRAEDPEGVLAYQRAWNAANADKKLAHRRAYRARIVAAINRAKDVPCVDCGGRFHPAAMDFDHVRGDKTLSVNRMLNVNRSLNVIRAEIAKCEVRCANCHRIRHALAREEAA